MKKEIKTYEVYCDSCGDTLYNLSAMIDNQGLNKSHLTHGEIDLCFRCAGKILFREVSNNIPEEKLKEWIKSLRKAEGDIELLEKKLVARQTKNDLKFLDDL